jgi:hypothetical protein
MSQDAEKVKRLVSFKQKLEKRVEELDSELKELQATLETVNSILLEKGFKRVEIGKTPVAEKPETLPSKQEMPIQHEPSTEYESVTQLKTASGEVLAILCASDESLRVFPAEDKGFNVNTPPFGQFLVQKVFAKMQEKDNELVREGQLTPERVFSYSIAREGDVIREIVIKNVDAERLRELKSSIRWTLEKMYEKMKSQS